MLRAGARERAREGAGAGAHLVGVRADAHALVLVPLIPGAQFARLAAVEHLLAARAPDEPHVHAAAALVAVLEQRLPHQRRVGLELRARTRPVELVARAPTCTHNT